MADSNARVLPAGELQNFLGKVSLHCPENQEVIVVTQDKAKLVFTEWGTRIHNKTGWHTPLGIVATLALTMCTSSFQDQTWIKSGTLKGFALLALILALVWLLRSVWTAYKSPSAIPEKFIASLLEGTRKTEYSVSPDLVNSQEAAPH